MLGQLLLNLAIRFTGFTWDDQIAVKSARSESHAEMQSASFTGSTKTAFDPHGSVKEPEWQGQWRSLKWL